MTAFWVNRASSSVQVAGSISSHENLIVTLKMRAIRSSETSEKTITLHGVIIQKTIICSILLAYGCAGMQAQSKQDMYEEQEEHVYKVNRMLCIFHR
jgi:hypothetical protein